jgi:hypothetical protein
MAFYRGPRIVTNGLVLALDAANPKSYAYGSTLWNNLSGDKYSGSLNNAPALNNDSYGSLTFNGSNQYVDFGNLSGIINTTTITFSIWLKWSGLGVDKTILGNEPFYANGILTNPVGFGLRQRSNNNYWLSLGTGTPAIIDYTPTISRTNWHNVAVTTNGSTATLYINGIQVSSAACAYVIGTTSSFSIGRVNTPAPTEYWGGSVSSFNLYNRALSAVEIAQNYNAMQSRFQYPLTNISTYLTLTQAAGLSIYDNTIESTTYLARYSSYASASAFALVNDPII